MPQKFDYNHRVRVVTLVLLAATVSPAELRKLTILHTNDLHARFQPNDAGHGGFAHLATAIAREKAGCHWCIALDAGDLVRGSPIDTIFRGVPTYKIASLIGIDVGTLGNHEFSFGLGRFREFRRVSRFPLLSANVVDESGRWIADAPYLIQKVNGIRLGIIGVTLGAEPGPWRFSPFVDAVRKYSAELRPRTDLIIVLGHIPGGPTGGPAILKHVSEVAVVVSGHFHNGLREAINIDGRLEVRVNGYGEELGRLDLEVAVPPGKIASSSWKRITIDAKSLPPHPRVAREVAVWEAKVAKIVDVPIGESKRALYGRPVVELIQRAMREELKADFVYVGGVRDGLPQGRLLARHIWNIMPFDDITVIGRFRGRDLPRGDVSTQRPGIVIHEGQIIEPETEYTFATTTYYVERLGLKFPRTGPVLRDLIIDWIRKKKVLE